MPLLTTSLFAIMMSLVWGGLVFSQELRLNQVQVLGTHNSYRQCAIFVPIIAPTVAYSHPRLSEQLNLGIRQL